METTIEKKSIVSKENVLTDNFLGDNDLSHAMELLDYKLRSAEKETKKSLSGNEAEFKLLFNNKISALSTKKKFVNREYFKQTQNWIGYIVEIHEDSFLANVDDSSGSGTYEMADFFIKDVSAEDQKLISLGSIFYWSVGYNERRGQIYKESFIRFQRLPPWDVEELNNVVDQATNLRRKLKWED